MILKLLKTVDSAIKRIEEAFLALSILAISGLIFYNVILRYLFGGGWAPSSELSIVLMVISTFIGCSYAARKGAHLSMSAIYDVDFISIRKRKIFMIISSALIALFSFVLAYYGALYVRGNFISGRGTFILDLPYWIINAFFPLCLFLMGVHYLKNIYINIKEEELYAGPEEEAGGRF